jgi:hypothetical protein
MYNITNTPILITPVVFLVAVSMTTTTALAQQQAGWNEGWSTGLAQAQSDFRNSVPYADKCDAHGYGDQSPGFCLGFKAGYITEWGVMGLAH